MNKRRNKINRLDIRNYKPTEIVMAIAIPLIIKSILPFGEMIYIDILATTLFLLVISYWFYQVGIISFRVSQGLVSLSLNHFKFNFWYFLVFSLIMILIRAYDFQTVIVQSNLFYLFIIFQVYYVFGFIYLLYFLSKSLQSSKIEREAKFVDYFNKLILFCFFPIGVWWLQKEVNTLARSE